MEEQAQIFMTLILQHKRSEHVPERKGAMRRNSVGRAGPAPARAKKEKQKTVKSSETPHVLRECDANIRIT